MQQTYTLGKILEHGVKAFDLPAMTLKQAETLRDQFPVGKYVVLNMGAE